MRQIILPGLIASMCLGLIIHLPGQAAQEGRARRKKIPWSFQTPVRPPLPAVKDASWVRNPIDAFVLARLEEAGLEPSSPASREQLIRRLSFDLTGLPPTTEEVEAFVQDDSPEAYEKLVDRLLASPRYGERWALYWLDLVRYAETDGFKADDIRPTAWRYRDYVIKAFNEDRPYDQFLREQLAGDELHPEDPWAVVATAFNRHFLDEYNASNLDQRRQEILNDITDVTASVFLGLTLGCAKCHDHKYDPISQEDYYRFQAFFAGFAPRDDLPLAAPVAREKYEKQLDRWEAQTAELREQMEALEGPYRQKMVGSNKSKFPKAFQDAYDLPWGSRTPFQKQIAAMLGKQLVVDEGQMVKSMKGDERQEWDELNAQMKTFDRLKPATLPVTMGLTDIGPEAPPTFLLQRGNHNKPGAEVQPGFPLQLDGSPAKVPPPAPGAKTTGRRTVLADWLASPKNPLTARVMVNRLWQHHFGRGIVDTPGDFGAQGDLPSHPELLDWLATEFVARGWSLKAMHRLMVTSTTYRQASVRTPEGEKIDPQNRLLWRMNPRRLEGEALRDAMLLVSGTLNRKMGGPSVLPELPRELNAGASGWKVTPDRREHYRRSIYVFLKRNLRYPLFGVFDAPDGNESCARRHISTNAPQALTLLNGDFTLEMARALAGRALQGASSEPEHFIENTYRLALGRLPDAQELTLAQEFLLQQAALVRQRLEDNQPTALPASLPESADPAFAGAAVAYCHVVLNLNEFLYVD